MAAKRANSVSKYGTLFRQALVLYLLAEFASFIVALLTASLGGRQTISGLSSFVVAIVFIIGFATLSVRQNETRVSFTLLIAAFISAMRVADAFFIGMSILAYFYSVISIFIFSVLGFGISALWRSLASHSTAQASTGFYSGALPEPKVPMGPSHQEEKKIDNEPKRQAQFDTSIRGSLADVRPRKDEDPGDGPENWEAVSAATQCPRYQSSADIRKTWAMAGPIVVPSAIILLFVTNIGEAGPIAPTIGGISLLAILYFIPTIIAFSRTRVHPHRWWVFLINLTLGLTFLGWCFAFYVACCLPDESKSGNLITKTIDGMFGDGEAIKKCPLCAETIKAAAKVCRFCGHKM